MKDNRWSIISQVHIICSYVHKPYQNQLHCRNIRNEEFCTYLYSSYFIRSFCPPPFLQERLSKLMKRGLKKRFFRKLVCPAKIIDCSSLFLKSRESYTLIVHSADFPPSFLPGSDSSLEEGKSGI